MYHYYATLIQIQVNTRTVGILKRPINAHVRAHSRTSENKLSKTAKPLFIGSIPIAASKFLQLVQVRNAIAKLHRLLKDWPIMASNFSPSCEV
jgi:hypothetical protein